MRSWALALSLVVLAPAARAEEPPKTSPFSAVRWEGERAHVEVNGATVELLAIDRFDLPAIVAFAKKTYEAKWSRRIEEDLGEVLAGMGGALGRSVDLTVRGADGKERRLERVPSTKENRGRLRDARMAAQPAAAGESPPDAPARVKREHAQSVPPEFVALPSAAPVGERLTGAQAAEDLDQLEELLETRFAYLRRRPVEYRMHLDAIRLASANGTTAGDFALRLQSLLARFGDGHSGVEGWDAVPAGGFAPFLVADSGDGPVAFHRKRSGFVDPDHPVLETLDGLPLDRWTEAAARLVADASPSFARLQRVRALRHVGLLRVLLGVPPSETVKVGLANVARTSRLMLTLTLADRKPRFGEWPVAASRLLDGGIGYWRVAEMDGSPEAMGVLHDEMNAVAGSERLIVDVRGNGGGDRDVSLRMLARLLPADAGPRVVNAAVYRLGPGEAAERPGGWLENRLLYPVADDRWTPGERRVIAAFAEGFRPEWSLPAGERGALHVAVVAPVPGPRPKKIVVLLDSGCFSATDVFLGGIEGAPGVTLVGTTSGGGSGRKRSFRLAHSGIEVELSSMVSYRPDGRLYDGNGIEADVTVLPAATDHIGRTDQALDKALELLTK